MTQAQQENLFWGVLIFCTSSTSLQHLIWQAVFLNDIIHCYVLLILVSYGNSQTEA